MTIEKKKSDLDVVVAGESEDEHKESGQVEMAGSRIGIVPGISVE